MCLTKFLSKFFHNGLNYDYCFIIKELAKQVSGTIWMSWGKHRKGQNFFGSDRKRGYKSW